MKKNCISLCVYVLVMNVVVSHVWHQPPPIKWIVWKRKMLRCWAARTVEKNFNSVSTNHLHSAVKQLVPKKYHYFIFWEIKMPTSLCLTEKAVIHWVVTIQKWFSFVTTFNFVGKYSSTPVGFQESICTLSLVSSSCQGSSTRLYRQRGSILHWELWYLIIIVIYPVIPRQPLQTKQLITWLE